MIRTHLILFLTTVLFVVTIPASASEPLPPKVPIILDRDVLNELLKEYGRDPVPGGAIALGAAAGIIEGSVEEIVRALGCKTEVPKDDFGVIIDCGGMRLLLQISIALSEPTTPEPVPMPSSTPAPSQTPAPGGRP